MQTFQEEDYRETNQIKPDIVAPGVDIISAAVGGGLSVKKWDFNGNPICFRGSSIAYGMGHS